MARLWMIVAALLAVLFYGAGCTRSALPAPDDGGVPDGGPGCRALDELACKTSNLDCVADYCFACACSPAFAACRRPGDAPTMCPDYGCPQPLCECEGLPESACLTSSLGCTPMYCPDCKGGQYYVTCLGPGSGSGACPAVCPVDSCRSDQDCAGQFCQAPGEFPGCGPCRVDGNCGGDGDCAPNEICGFDPCSCTNSGMACIPGCAQAGCPEGQTCGSSNHCFPQWCQKPNDCPAHFECASNQCQRRICFDDSSCPGGYCVEGFCYSMLGQCFIPPP